MKNLFKKITLFVLIIFLDIQNTYGASELQSKVIGTAEDMNKRPYMQDYIKVILEYDKDTAFFGLFDGHGGEGYNVAKYVGDNLYKNIIKDPIFINNIEKAIKNGFLKTDFNLDEKLTLSGTTAVVALIKDKIYIAWVGDSRAIKITKDWQGIDLSIDHKPDRKDEQERLNKIGFQVITVDGIPRVFDRKGKGGLAISRSFGDKNLSPGVIPEPEVISYSFDKNDNFLILASDGVWDVLTTQEVANFIKEKSKKNLNLNNLAHMLLEEAKQKGSEDNLSVIIVDLKNLKNDLNIREFKSEGEELSEATIQSNLLKTKLIWIKNYSNIMNAYYKNIMGFDKNIDFYNALDSKLMNISNELEKLEKELKKELKIEDLIKLSDEIEDLKNKMLSDLKIIINFIKSRFNDIKSIAKSKKIYATAGIANSLKVMNKMVEHYTEFLEKGGGANLPFLIDELYKETDKLYQAIVQKKDIIDPELKSIIDSTEKKLDEISENAKKAGSIYELSLSVIRDDLAKYRLYLESGIGESYKKEINKLVQRIKRLATEIELEIIINSTKEKLDEINKTIEKIGYIPVNKIRLKNIKNNLMKYEANFKRGNIKESYIESVKRLKEEIEQLAKDIEKEEISP